MTSLNGTLATIKKIVASTLQEHQTRQPEQSMEQLKAENEQLREDNMRLTKETKELTDLLKQAGRKHREEKAHLDEVKAELATEKQANILLQHTVESLSKVDKDTQPELKRLQEAYDTLTKRVRIAEQYVHDLLEDLAQATYAASESQNQYNLMLNTQSVLTARVLGNASELKSLMAEIGLKCTPFLNKLRGKSLCLVDHLLQNEIDSVHKLKLMKDASNAHTAQEPQTPDKMHMLIMEGLAIAQAQPPAQQVAACVALAKPSTPQRRTREFTISDP
jgi:DNA repair exonuclease SbcCD ATPase subunit